MTPTEKAIQLINLYCDEIGTYKTELVWNTSRRCALICVDKLMEESYEMGERARMEYWQEVKEQIEKL